MNSGQPLISGSTFTAAHFFKPVKKVVDMLKLRYSYSNEKLSR